MFRLCFLCSWVSSPRLIAVSLHWLSGCPIDAAPSDGQVPLSALPVLSPHLGWPVYCHLDGQAGCCPAPGSLAPAPGNSAVLFLTRWPVSWVPLGILSRLRPRCPSLKRERAFPSWLKYFISASLWSDGCVACRTGGWEPFSLRNGRLCVLRPGAARAI